MPHSKVPRPKVDIASMIDAITPETLHPSLLDDINNDVIDKLYEQANEAANKKRGYALTEDEIQSNFIRAGEESDKHAEATGLHVTSDEVNAWVESLKSNPNAKIPTCHV